MVMAAPLDAVAWMPRRLEPTTAPVALIDTGPAPLETVLMPLLPPVTVAASMEMAAPDEASA